MSEKAKVRVALFVGDLLVEESEDASLWNQVHAVMLGKQGVIKAPLDQQPNTYATLNPKANGDIVRDKIQEFADELEVSTDLVMGSCDPQDEEPYIHLNDHKIEAFKKKNASVSLTSCVATVIALWMKKINKNSTTLKDIKKVLSNNNLHDHNFSRSLSNRSWLIVRDKKVTINPAEISTAVAYVKAYVQGTSFQAIKKEIEK